jgi:16S rRNA (guanine527-N7)-methyltransferase
MAGEPEAKGRFLATLAAQGDPYGVLLTSEVAARLGEYFELLNRWNERLHLVAPCSPEEFARRHVLESLYMLRYLEEGSSVVDVGAGGGLPTIPCLIARPGLRATLIESSQRKAVFLREALRLAGVEGSRVIAERFEKVAPLKSDFVTCRALERFEEMLESLIEWSPPNSSLLLYGGEAIRNKLTEMSLEFREDLLPASNRRYLFIVPPRDHHSIATTIRV